MYNWVVISTSYLGGYMKDIPKLVGKNCCNDNAGCLATGLESLRFMVPYFNDDKTWELQSIHIYSSRCSGHIRQVQS